MPGNSTRVLAIRHGETAWNVDTRIQGQLDIGLNEVGRWQAQRVGQALAGEDLNAVYSSDLSRAFDTAQAVAEAAGLTVQIALHRVEVDHQCRGGDGRDRIAHTGGKAFHAAGPATSIARAPSLVSSREGGFPSR